MTRTFTSSPAVRKHTPLLLAMMGPSGGGKSYSALRIATGIARVQPGPIHVVDTEADRALQYSPRPGEKAAPSRGTFDFTHVPFGAPFGSLDYLDVLRHCEREGARTVIVDSMSHEHEGPGGMLDSAEAFLSKRAGDDWGKRQKLKMSSFIEPKAHRGRLILGMLQMKCNFILCFRAKEKIKPVAGKDPLNLGWQPICGDEFPYEMTARALLLPGANGVPEWSPQEVGEKLMSRRPQQFERILANGKQLSEDMGEQMARWAVGEERERVTLDGAIKRIRDASDVGALKQVAAAIGGEWSEADRATIRQAIEETKQGFSQQREPGDEG